MALTIEQVWQQHLAQIEQDFSCRQLDWQSFWQSLSSEQQSNLVKVGGISQFVATQLAKQANYFQQAISTDAISQAQNYADLKKHLTTLIQEQYPEKITEEGLHKALRLFRQRIQVQIIWRDLLRLASTLQTTRMLSDMADACINTAREYHYDLLIEKHGKPIGKTSKQEQPLLILGMGKLGAYELNLSSDIDLIFCYPESGTTTGNANGRRDITNQEFFIKLGQKIIQALDTNTPDGFVFRTDMRLRPYGQSGPLVMNFTSMEEYYQDQGRDWERYAMVKARIINGETSNYEQELLNILRPFTYRQYVDFGAFDALRSMKAMISAEVRRRGLEMNVKLGPGGIREVEFIVQAFQLIRGGQDAELQTRELTKILSILPAEGYLPDQVCQELKAAYLFLRDAEHVIQALNDEQTQQLPEDDERQFLIAQGMGFENWQSFVETLDSHREKVAFHFSQVVADENEEQDDGEQQAWQDLWLGQLEPEQQAEFLAHHPCTQSEVVTKEISKFRESKPIQTMQPIGRERLDALMPLLLKELWQQSQPVTTLERVIPLIESVARRTAYLVLLKENPQALEQLIKLCSVSPWLAEYIAQSPILLDELLNPSQLYQQPSKQDLTEELHLRLLRIDEEDLEQQMDSLRHFSKAHKLRAAACEIMGKLEVKSISSYLTDIAEVILEKVLFLSWQQMISKYGYPTDKDKQPVSSPEFVVVGYGKTGGDELSYSSDLDLVFLHNTTPNRMTDGCKENGTRELDNGVFYTRLGQRMIHILTTVTRAGDLYEVDMRLRPSGNSGMIATSVTAFERYQKDSAWTWEHQALVRARVVAGSPECQQDFEKVRDEILKSQRDIPALAEEVRSMRQKMRDNLGSQSDSVKAKYKNADTLFQLKQDEGGIVDIEFMVQFGVLAWAHKHAELTQVTDNVRLLDALAQAGFISSQDSQTLQETYLAYRAETHRQALQKQSLLLDADSVKSLGFDQRRAAVTKLWNELIIESLA